MTEIMRPGGALGNRPLHFFWIVDCSGSMIEDRIAAVNHAITTVLPSMREAAEEEADAQVLIHILKFSDSAAWITPAPVPLESFEWTNMDADQGALTSMGKAFELLAGQLTIPPMTERALPPVLVLLSDGQSTDDYKPPLEKLLNLPWGMKAVRVAIAIGMGADVGVLQEFSGNGELVLQANSPEELVKMIRWTSTIIKPVSNPPSRGIDEAAGESNVALNTASIPRSGGTAMDVW